MQKRIVNSNGVRAIAFILVFCLIYHFVNGILAPKWKDPVDTEDHTCAMEEFKGLESSPKALFLGTSHVKYGVNPMQIYDETGIATYNLSVSGRHIA